MSPKPDEYRIIEPLCAVFRRRLRDEGLKYTAERARILEAVLAMPGPFRVEDLLASLKSRPSTGYGPAPRVSKATAYRTMHLLQQCGILQQIMLHADEAHYQLAYGRASTAMLVRTDSGSVHTIDAPGLADLCAALCKQHGLTLDGQKLILYARKP